MKVTFNGQTLDLVPSNQGYLVSLNGKSIRAEVLHAEHGRFDLRIDDQHLTAHVTIDQPRIWVTLEGHTFVLTRSSGSQPGSTRQEHPSGLTAPMPGQVRAVQVQEGERVVKGQSLIVLEAMKMEIRVQAPADGRVKTLHVQPGQTVEREQVLVELEDV